MSISTIISIVSLASTLLVTIVATSIKFGKIITRIEQLELNNNKLDVRLSNIDKQLDRLNENMITINTTLKLLVPSSSRTLG